MHDEWKQVVKAKLLILGVCTLKLRADAYMALMPGHNW
jgi:hypothetical protein